MGLVSAQSLIYRHYAYDTLNWMLLTRMIGCCSVGVKLDCTLGGNCYDFLFIFV